VEMRETSHATGCEARRGAHGSGLLGLFFPVTAWSYWLDRLLLLFNDNGVVVGAAYTDVHIELPVLSSLAGGSADRATRSHRHG
jgi:uncharacterized membrane protein (UPF0182 family)